MNQSDLLQQLEETIRKEKNNTIKFVLLQELAGSFLREGRFEDAFTCYEDALKVAQKIGNRKLVRDTLIDLGSVSDNLGKADPAIRYFRQAFEIARNTRDFRMQRTILGKLAALYMKVQRPDLAAECYRRAAEAAHIAKAKTIKALKEKTEHTTPKTIEKSEPSSVIQSSIELSNLIERGQHIRRTMQRITFIARLLLLMTLFVIFFSILATSPISITKIITLGALAFLILIFIGILTFLSRFFFSTPLRD